MTPSPNPPPSLLNWEVSDTSLDTIADLKNIPLLFSSLDPRSLYLQLEAAYPGIQPATSLMFQLTSDNCLVYPNQFTMSPSARAVHLGERIFVYQSGFLVILQLSGSFQVFRLS